MNEIKILKSAFCVFGNFTNIINDISRIALKFPNFNKFISQEAVLNQPILRNVYNFKKDNFTIKIKHNRIDFIYSDIQGNSTLFDCEFVASCCALLFNDFKESIKINRLAFNLDAFLGGDIELLKRVISNLGVSKMFENPSEFEMRVNTITDYEGYNCNDINTISYSLVENVNTFKRESGVLVRIDFNTLVGSILLNVDDFQFDKTAKLFETYSYLEMNKIFNNNGEK